MWKSFRLPSLHGFSLPRPRTAQRRKLDLLLILSVASYFIGLIVGGGVLLSGDSTGYFALFAKHYLSLHLSQPAGAVWQSTFLSSMLLFSLLLFCAFSCIGSPLAACVPAFKGLCTGMLTSWLYQNLGVRGLFLNSLIFWLPAAGLALMTILLTYHSMQCSVGLMRSVLLGGAPLGQSRIRKLMRHFLFFSLCALALSLLEAALSTIFSPLFAL